MQERKKQPSISLLRIQGFRQKIFSWYRKNRRTLPWRATNDPYRIVVSEIMLQQTQVARVIGKYRAFLKEFPTVFALASAAQREVVRLWSGLGYNSRAVRLQKAAQRIVREYQGKVPTKVEELEALPGIGPYTARAVLAFAYRKDEVALDTNQHRVIGRFFLGIQAHPYASISAVAQQVLPRGRGYEWNHALMDFGALVCASRPHCFQCPLRQSCRAFPKILTTEKRKAKKSKKPFMGSDRYFRGKIVGLLRSKKRGLSHITTIQASVGKESPISLQHLSQLLLGLKRDELLDVVGIGQHQRARLR